jgi:hypothetical protein
MTSDGGPWADSRTILRMTGRSYFPRRGPEHFQIGIVPADGTRAGDRSYEHVREGWCRSRTQFRILIANIAQASF